MILILILIIIIIIIILNRETKHFNNNNQTFLNKTELINILLEDKDNYYKTFNETDLLVRGVNTIDEYKKQIKKACLDISKSNKKKLSKYITEANIKLRKYKIDGFDGEKCANIPWIIGLVNNKYENGYPHTRNDVIIMNFNKLLFNNVKTLIHEKIHIYQKMYPEDIQIYLQSNNFTKYISRKESTENLRANPDVDDYIYKMNDSVMMAIYNKNATSISDVNIYPKNEYKYEHPYEYMAYTLENIIN